MRRGILVGTLLGVFVALTVACIPPGPARDVVAPVMSLPEQLVVVATSGSGAPVDWTATATDAVDGSVPVVCTPPSGTFPMGITQVACTATDAAGNTASGGFAVTVVPSTELDHVTQVQGGAAHTCGLLVDTSVVCWGANNSGQRGDGTIAPSPLRPTAVVGLTSVVQLAAGFQHTCALLVDTTVRCWGQNDYGQLGDGTATGRTTPVAVTGLSGVVSLTTGGAHTCALLDDSTVTCWGRNQSGQLGNGTVASTVASHPIPAVVAGLTDVVDVEGGANHTCVVLGDGTGRCWGSNSNGQLGDGTTVDATAPVVVDGLAQATQIAGGHYHSCALVGAGSVQCWGRDQQGALGDGGANVDSSVPVEVVGIMDATDIAVDQGQSCARTASGIVSCWGANQYAEFGIGTRVGSSTPVPVSGLADVVSLTTGGTHGCASLSSGSVRCWGWNAFARMGNGTLIDALTPTTVVSVA